MNERINEIYEKALEQHQSNNMAWEEVNYEKFAEFLIEECITVAKNSDKYGTLAWFEIKEHFGIK